MGPEPENASNTSRNALVLIAVILTGAALTWMAPILTPLALAAFLMLMIDAMARDLHGRLPALGTGAALAAAIATCILVFAVVVYSVAGHAAGFVGKLVAYQPRINVLLATVSHDLHVRMPRTVAQLISRIDLARVLPFVASGVQSLVQNGALVLIYLGFLLASRHGFERKVVRLFHGRQGRHGALQAFLRVRDAVERYLWIQTVCTALIALGSWCMMMAIGLESAFFWTFLIFVIGYIPIVGAAIGIIAPSIFALLQFPDIWQGAALGAGMLALSFIVGNIVMPRMQGRSLNIDPVVLLLSLAFWGAVWGVTGMFLATPLTILTTVILAQFDGTRWIAVLLSADGDPHSLGAPHPGLLPLRSQKSEAAAL